MFTALLILQVVLGLSIIGLVLLQQGKGADMGAAFGAGASGSVFGARGSGSFFSRATAIMATLFFANSILLSSPLVLHERNPNASVTTTAPAVEETDVPPVGEDGIEVDPAMDLPPADLPAIEDGAEKPADDLPDVTEPADVPAPADQKSE